MNYNYDCGMLQIQSQVILGYISYLSSRSLPISWVWSNILVIQVKTFLGCINKPQASTNIKLPMSSDSIWSLPKI